VGSASEFSMDPGLKAILLLKEGDGIFYAIAKVMSVFLLLYCSDMSFSCFGVV